MLKKKKSPDIYENRFHFLIDNILHVVGELDLKGIFTYVNPYIYDELGYQPEEIIGRSIFEFIHPDDVKKVIKVLHKGFNSRGSAPEVRLKNENNQFIWFEINSRRKKDFANETKIIINLKNISKFKLLERNLQKKKENFKNLTESFPEFQFWKVMTPKKYKGVIHATSEMLNIIIENIPQCVYWKDTEFKYLGCNRNYTNFIGLDHPESIIGKTNEELFSDKRKIQQIQEIENSIIQSGKPKYHRNEIWITAEGKEIWIDINRVPLFDSDGKVIGILITSEEITDRKIAEEKLQKSEEKYKNLSYELETILDIIPVMIFIKDKDDVYTRVNQVFADYLQLNKEVIIGKTTYDLFPQELATNLRKDDLEVMKSGIPKLNIKETANFPGSKVSGIIKKVPYYNEKEEINGVIGVAVDITERKNLEQELETTEERYRQLFNNSPNMIALMNLSGKIIDVNESLLKFTGEEKSNIIGKIFQDFDNYFAGNLPILIKKYKEILNNGLVESFELELHDKNSSTNWVNLQASLIEIKNEMFIQVIMENITERKKIKKDLKENINKFKGIFEESSMTLALYDSDGKLVDANKACLELINVSDVDIIKGYDMFSDPNLPEDTKKKLQNGQQAKFELIYDHDKVKNTLRSNVSGKTYFEAIITPLFDDKGKLRFYLNQAQDITERKISEQQLKKSEEKFKYLTEQGLMGIAILQDDLLKYVNKRLAKLLGYNVEEMMNWQPGEFVKVIHPEDKELVMEQAKKKQTGVSDIIIHYQYRLIKKTGEIVWIENHSKTIIYEGKPADFVSIVDITEQKKVQQKLEESEKKYRNIINNVMDIIVEIDLMGTFLYVSPQVYDIVGYHPEEAIGVNGFNLIHPDDLPKAKLILKDAIKSRESVYLEFRTLHKQGHYIDVSANGRVLSMDGVIKIIAIIRNITDRKRAERKLKESKLLLQRTFDSLNDAIFILNAENPPKIINCNSAAVKMFGYSYDEMIGQDTEFLHVNEDKLQKFQDHLYHIIKDDGYLQDFEFKMKRKTGVGFFTEHSAFPLVDDLGTQYGWVSVVRDITNRKKAEEKIQYQAKLVENVSDAILSLDMEFNILSWNKAAEKIYGWTADEVIGENLRDIIPVEFENTKNQEIVSDFFEKGFWSGEGIQYKKDGTKLYIHSSSTLIYNALGKPTGMVTINRDITERKKVEQKLKESEEKYRNLVETSSMGLIEIDVRGGDLVYINPRLLEIVGYSQDDLISNGMFYKVFYSNDYKKVVKSEEDRDIEFRLLNKEGKVKWLSGRTLHHYNEQGELLYLRLWLQDITESKEIENIKSNLLTRISHEIKTPLISIKGFADLLLTEYRSSLNEKTISFIERIKEGGERLKLLINRFLESTQLDTGLIKLNKSYENLSTLIKIEVEKEETLIKLRNHTIIVDVPDDLIVYIDREKIQSIVSNLLINAIKYTPNGGNIAIKSKIKKKSLRISVKDDGIGLVKEEIGQLFKLFGKVERYGKGWNIISDGLGLGLYLSKEIMDLHNGKIWAESPGLNKGSTFYFSLPIMRNNNEE